MKLIKQNDVLQAHPEFLNEQIDDHDKAIYAKGWNDCNKEYYNAITELPVAPMACTDLSTRLRRAFEADELVNQLLLLDAADAIEELLKENGELENSGRVLMAAFARLKEKVPQWISVKERLPKTRSSILGQKSNKVIVAFRFDDGTQGTDTAHTLNGDWVFEDRIVVVNRTVTHWMPLPKPPKEVNDEV